MRDGAAGKAAPALGHHQRRAFANYGCAIVFDDLKDARRMADVVAPEHLEVVTAAPRELLPYLHNAGAIFLGQYARTAR